MKDLRATSRLSISEFLKGIPKEPRKLREYDVVVQAARELMSSVVKYLETPFDRASLEMRKDLHTLGRSRDRRRGSVGASDR